MVLLHLKLILKILSKNDPSSDIWAGLYKCLYKQFKTYLGQKDNSIY